MDLGKRLQSAHSALKLYFVWMLSLLDAGEAMVEDWVDATPLGRWEPKTRLGERAQTSAVLTVVVVGIVIIIGILVYAEIESSLPSPDNNELQNASDNATGTFGDAMELAPVILLVLIASVILAVVQRFR